MAKHDILEKELDSYVLRALLSVLSMQIVHVVSDFLSTLPGLWEQCVQGNVVLLFYFIIPF